MSTTSFTTRRIRNVLLATLSAVVVCLWVRVSRNNLQDVSLLTGYSLAAMIVFLAAYNVRKKLVLFPLGTSAGWLQFHIYVGLLTPILLGLHINWRMPQGQFELLLFIIYSCTFVSGVYGFYLTRTLPRMLTRLPEELLYEQYATVFQEIRCNADEVVSDGKTSTDILSQLYVNNLHSYFTRRRLFFYYLLPTTSKRRQLLKKVQAAKRYASVDEQTGLSRIEELVTRRDDLDFHHALQWKLRGWLFIHLGLTYSLLLLIMAHLVLVHVFREGF